MAGLIKPFTHVNEIHFYSHAFRSNPASKRLKFEQPTQSNSSTAALSSMYNGLIALLALAGATE
jgi:hypothetical protein